MTINKTSLAASFALAAGLVTAATGIASAQDASKDQGGYAVVDADGTLVRQLNINNVSHPSTGVYLVQFDHKIAKCAPEATIQGDPGFILPGYIVVAKYSGIGVQVSTFATLTLLPADFKFSLTVTCS
jgi:hypothetical protein